MIKVVIAFSQESFNELLIHDSSNTLFITDKRYGVIKGSYIENIDLTNQEILCNDVNSFFKEFSELYSCDELYGFVNNFYECTIYPISNALLKLESLKSKFSNEVINVYMNKNYFFTTCSSFYFMSEHESQGVHLYNREYFFHSYLSRLCKKLEFNIFYNVNCYSIINIFLSHFRISIIFILRLFLSLYRNFTFKNFSSIKKNPFDLIFITRSISQSSSIINFVKLSGVKSLIISGSSFLDFSSNIKYLKSVLNDSSHSFISLGFGRFDKILKAYFICLRNIIFLKKINFKVGLTDLNLKNSLREVFVFLPDLIIYNNELNSILSSSISSSPRIISLEQKSPYAFIDSNVASKFELKCFHLMQCDQDIRLLPNLVFGDRYLTDTSVKANNFKSLSKLYYSKFTYIGSFKAIYNKFNRLIPLSLQSKIYYFTHSDDIEFNINIINFLVSFCSNTGCKLYVKLHPRDFKFNYKNNDFVTYISDSDCDRDLIFNDIDIAISAPSGIVTDLIFRNIPVIILGFGPGYNHNIYDYWSNSYIGCVDNIVKLSLLLNNINDYSNELNSYGKIYRDKVGCISDPVVIKENLLNLV